MQGRAARPRSAAEGRGVLCASAIAMVAMDRASMSFMPSDPNPVPPSAQQVVAIATALEPFEFDRLYGIFSISLF